AGALQTVGGTANSDAFVIRLNANGTAAVYSTYLGGATGADQGNGIAVNGAGEAFVTGFTASADFPIPPLGAFQNVQPGGGDAFVTKLNAAGTALSYGTYLGGSGGSDQGNGITLDGAGNAYVVGTTNSTNFPTTAGAFQTGLNAPFFNAADAFVT